MGRVRDYDFDAVIGVGGIGPEAISNRIEPRVMWIGIGRHNNTRPLGYRGPQLGFDHFFMYGPNTGPELDVEAENLAKHLYKGGARFLLNLTDVEHQEALKILACALKAPPSRGVVGHGTRGSSRCPSTPIIWVTGAAVFVGRAAYRNRKPPSANATEPF
jgi:hypothetical protein